MSWTKQAVDKLTPEVLAKIDWTPLEVELSKRLGTFITLQASVNSAGRPVVIADQDLLEHSGVFKAALSEVTLQSFGGSVIHPDNDLWISMHLFYDLRGGGSNGVKVLDALYNFDTRQWRFQ